MPSIISKSSSILTLNEAEIDQKVQDAVDESGGGGGITPHTQSFTTQTEVVVNHGLGRKPIIAVVDQTGEVITETVDIDHQSDNQFTVNSTQSMTGVILYF